MANECWEIKETRDDSTASKQSRFNSPRLCFRNGAATFDTEQAANRTKGTRHTNLRSAGLYKCNLRSLALCVELSGNRKRRFPATDWRANNHQLEAGLRKRVRGAHAPQNVEPDNLSRTIYQTPCLHLSEIDRMLAKSQKMLQGQGLNFLPFTDIRTCVCSFIYMFRTHALHRSLGKKEKLFSALKLNAHNFSRPWHLGKSECPV